MNAFHTHFLVLTCSLILPLVAVGDDIHTGLPEPDALPAPCPPEALVAPIPEAHRQVFHQVSQQYGIDVSHYQGRINWQMVRTDQNASFVYIKATESSTLVDGYYQLNQREARLAGIPVGVYHFFSPSASALAQMRNISDNVDPRQQDLAPILDIEKRGKLSLAEFQGRVQTMLTQMESFFGRKPIIYTGVNFYNKNLAGKFLDYRFMIARYADELPPLNDDGVQVILWQFTAKGSVNGIRGFVDRSVFIDGHSLQEIMQ